MDSDTASTSVTATEFCAVTVVIVLQPKHCKSFIVAKSACMPAPPPLSEPAIVQTMGDMVSKLCGCETFMVKPLIQQWS